MSLNLTALNQSDDEAFISALAGIFEHSPWIPAAVLAQRPFRSRSGLFQALAAVVEHAPAEDQLALICAHPELAGQAAVAGQLTAASTDEQQAAGLDRCSPEQFAELTALNGAYQARFGFPFILAVAGHDPDSVLAELRRRLTASREQEIAENLRQIECIAERRLRHLITD